MCRQPWTAPTRTSRTRFREQTRLPEEAQGRRRPGRRKVGPVGLRAAAALQALAALRTAAALRKTGVPAAEPADKAEPGAKGAPQAEPPEARAQRHVRGYFARAYVGTLAPKDLAASRPARATVNRRRVRPATWVQQRRAGVLPSVESFSGYSASRAHPLQVWDWRGSVVSCVQTVASIGSAYPTSVPRQAPETRAWSAVAPSEGSQNASRHRGAANS
jgi:hypothetical protein